MADEAFSFELGDPYADELGLLARRTAKESVLAMCPRLLARLPATLAEPGQIAVERAVVLREALREVLRVAYPLALERDRVASDVMAGGAIVGLVSESRWSGLSPDQMRQVDMSKRARQLTAATWLGSGNVTTERGMRTYEKLSLNALRLALLDLLRDDEAVRRLARRLRRGACGPRQAAADPSSQEGPGEVSEAPASVPVVTERPRPPRRRRRWPFFIAALVVAGTVTLPVLLWLSSSGPSFVTAWSRVSSEASSTGLPIPADLSTEPWIFCPASRCAIAIIQLQTGTPLAETCRARGQHATSRKDLADGDDPGQYVSGLRYRVWVDGQLEYLSEVWVPRATVVGAACRRAGHHSQENP